MSGPEHLRRCVTCGQPWCDHDVEDHRSRGGACGDFQPFPDEDERPHVYVHAEVPSSDDVRTFYEIPSVVADHVRAVAPEAAFVEALVQVFEGIDTMRDGQAILRDWVGAAGRLPDGTALSEEARVRARAIAFIRDIDG